MRAQTHKHMTDRSIDIGDWVLLKLQSFRQNSVRGQHHKIEPGFFGPYQVSDKVGNVSYRIAIPTSAHIHDVFYVSQLRPTSPPIDPVPELPHISRIKDVFPQAILDRRMVCRHNQATAPVAYTLEGFFAGGCILGVFFSRHC